MNEEVVDEVEEVEEEDDKDEKRFEALCAALRRNDPDNTEICYHRFSSFPRRQGRRLGESLQGNEYVASMVLNLDELLAVDEEGTESVALLLRYIRESKAMRKVSLWWDRYPFLSAVRLFLLAIAANPCIEALGLHPSRTLHPFPSEAFALLLQTTQSLKTLDILLSGDGTAAERELVVEAFGANRTLESLFLLSYSTTGTDMVESVLLQLAFHPCLRELTLESRMGMGVSASAAQCNALAYLLCSTMLLKHLVFRQFMFDKDCTECLVEGLHSNQSLTKLSFILCGFNLEAMDVFSSFMRTGETRSSIRELCISGYRSVYNGLSANPFLEILASMLSMPDENQGRGSCITSSLQVLTLNLTGERFYNALAANASRIRLPCLRCCRVSGNNDWKALTKCLPHLVYLKELHCPIANRNITREVVDALRQNGSLQKLTFSDGLEVFKERERHLMKSYCKRNESIPMLVAKVRLDKGNDDDKTDFSLLPMLFQAAKQAPRTAPNSMLIGLLFAGYLIGPRQDVQQVVPPNLRTVQQVVPPNLRTLAFERLAGLLRSWLLLPTILKSAKQALRTAPNAILIALVTAGDSIGPHRQYGNWSSPFCWLRANITDVIGSTESDPTLTQLKELLRDQLELAEMRERGIEPSWRSSDRTVHKSIPL